MNLPIYLDYNATTPVHPAVADAMEPYLREHFGNPSSSHVFGQRALLAVESARQQVASLIGANADEIVFTGCGSEANNLAIQGSASALRDKGRHMITCAIEHPAVEQPMRWMSENGWDVSVLGVDRSGMIDLNELASQLRDDTVFVSIMHANNEVGTIQPISEIARLTSPKGILLHTDAAQSVSKIPVQVDQLGVDLLALVGHKFYASKGIGALYVKRGTPIHAVIHGASHEFGLRPGTENVPAIVGLGEAAKLASQANLSHSKQLGELRDHLHALLLEAIPDLHLNGHPELRLPSTLNVSFPGVEGRQLLQHASADVAASVGSACHEDSSTVSGVLGAMGIEQPLALGAVRLSVGSPSNRDDIEHAAAALIASWRVLAGC